MLIWGCPMTDFGAKWVSCIASVFRLYCVGVGERWDNTWLGQNSSKSFANSFEGIWESLDA